MSDKLDPTQPTIYQIRIKGHLGQQWADWFEGLSITLEENGDTLLTGPVIDDAALHGLLKRVRDLGMPLIAVNRVPRTRRSSHSSTKLETHRRKHKTIDKLHKPE